MPEGAQPKIRFAAVSTAFQQMCSFAAIADTRNPKESLRELILHTLLTFDGEKFASAQDVSNTLSAMFGVEAPDHQVQEALDRMMTDGHVHRPLGTNYVLTPDARGRVRARIEQASSLQERVKGEWQAETAKRFPGLELGSAWAVLQSYLAKTFLRHGIQAAAFLDPSVEIPSEYATSLSTLLAEAIDSMVDTIHRPSAREAISSFLAAAGEDPERARYIAECADGAFNYFSLTVAPEVAARFREKLSPLVLFCDTNFLFGILDLHVHPQVEVSNDLLRVIAEQKLPFRLRYHERTLRETQATIAHYGDQLRRHRWSQSLSRAVTTSPFVSGIELKYHQRNAETGMDVDSFLRPYQHVDVLLKERGIDIYKPPTDRQVERATLLAEYSAFLKGIHRDKPYDVVDHDVTVLDCVHSLRGKAGSTLEAAALLVSCDYTLYSFDSEASRKERTYASVVLPNVFWQVLRPFVPANRDFDRSFAETFAIPEFRTIGSGAAKACSKMLGLLAAYKNISEDTAARLLSNDMLIERLRSTSNEEQFQAEVESAIASENQALLEERAAMAKEIESLKADKERAEKELEQQRQTATSESAKAREMLQAREKEAEELTAFREKAQSEAEEAISKLAEHEAAKASAEKAAKQELEGRQKAERLAKRYAVIAALAVSAFLIAAFEAMVYVFPWNWLKYHVNSFGLQMGINVAILLFVLGLFRPRWRKVCWITILIPLLAVVVSLLGGPGSAGPSTQKAP